MLVRLLDYLCGRKAFRVTVINFILVLAVYSAAVGEVAPTAQAEKAAEAPSPAPPEEGAPAEVKPVSPWELKKGEEPARPETPAEEKAPERIEIKRPPAHPRQLPTREEGPGRGMAVLNFTEADLKDIIRTISELTGENFIISPGITARITVHTVKPVPRKDVFAIFESILEANRLAAVRAGDYYKIVPAASAKQLGGLVIEGSDPGAVPPGEGFVNLVFPADYVSVNDLLQILKPMLSPSGNIAAYGKTNTLVVTDVAANVRKLLEIAEALDIDAFEKMNVTLVPVKNVDARVMARELGDVFSALGLEKDATRVSVVPIERLNSLIVFSASQDLLDSVKAWIERLDTASTKDGAGIHIYYVKNDKASNLKAILEQVYGGKKESSAAPRTAPEDKRVEAPEGAPRVEPARYSNPARAEREVAGAGPGGIEIFLYEPSNALIIQASAGDYQYILNTIEELDRPPKQALIDAMVLEVSLDEETRYGIQWSALTGNLNIQQNTAIFSNTINNPRGTLSTPVGLAAPTGLSVFATDLSKFFAAIQAFASEGKVNVLSNPHILVKNYEKASITVGSDEPIATQSTQTAVTGTASLIQNIEYRKTGIILTVTPHITEGGVVAMTIRQEISDISTSRVVGTGTFPSFTKREAETSVVAKDSETIVIGGLIEERNDVNERGIPLLGKIPIIGSLFRFTTLENDRTELVILLTPRVVTDSLAAATMSEGFKGKLEDLKKLLEKKGLYVPEGKGAP